jgi:peptidoglycan/xylan/chitin deacetylase (PgdA/CDA1 family)
VRRLLPLFYLASASSFLFAFVACSAALGDVPKDGSTSAASPTDTSTATAFLTATQTEAPTPVTAPPSLIRSVTPSDSPTPVPSPTAFLTPPPAGQFVAIPILMYHHLKLLEPTASLTQRTWTVSPASFKDQLDYLSEHGYHTITFVQLEAFFEDRAPLPLHPIILTFDDGWRDDYDVAFPLLRERGMVGTFFVPTAYADAASKTLIDWSQIGEMDAAGMEFGGHTINHANLKEVSKEEALRQLENSKSKMEEELGHATMAFAYPFGAYDLSVVGMVRQVGYRMAVGLCCGFKLRADILLILPRIRISFDDTLQDFVKRLPPQ